MKTILNLIAFTLAALSLSSQIAVAPHTGNGTEENPYQICDLTHLFWIAADDDMVGNPDQNTRLSGHYIQLTNIDATETANWFDGKGWYPIGNDCIHFTGTYNGMDHSIDGLFINRPGQNHIGLFGYASEARIENLNLTNTNIAADYSIGALAGFISSGSLVSNCYVSGIITGISHNTGGLVGMQDESEIRACVNSAMVIASSSVGGLVGRSLNSILSDCGNHGNITGISGIAGGIAGDLGNTSVINSYNGGNITGQDHIGGISGWSFNNSIITECYNEGIIAGNDRVGGIAGINWGMSEISKSINTGDITGNDFIGGLVGWNYNNSSVYNSFSKGSVSGRFRVGGLAGLNWGNASISKTFSTGPVSGEHWIGGLVGKNHSMVEFSYWNTQKSNQAFSDGGEGKTTEEMIFPYADNIYTGWNFEEKWAADIYSELNEGYPFLQWQKFNVPNIAYDPFPECGSADIPLTIENFKWSYNLNPAYTIPAGFRIYMNTTGRFRPDDDYQWVIYSHDQVEYECALIFSELESGTTYYWKVIPTTSDPSEVKRSVIRSGITQTNNDNSDSQFPGDAADCPEWSFTTVITTGIDITEVLPATMLIGNYPNPFNQETTIHFSLAEFGYVKLEIFEITGKKIKTLISEYLIPGEFELKWDTTNNKGLKVNSGIYMYTLRTDNYQKSGRMLLLR